MRQYPSDQPPPPNQPHAFALAGPKPFFFSPPSTPGHPAPHQAGNLLISLGFLTLVCAASFVWGRCMPARVVRHVAGSMDQTGPEGQGEPPASPIARDTDVGVMLIGANEGVVLPPVGLPVPDGRHRDGDGDKQPLLA